MLLWITNSCSLQLKEAWHKMHVFLSYAWFYRGTVARSCKDQNNGCELNTTCTILIILYRSPKKQFKCVMCMCSLFYLSCFNNKCTFTLRDCSFLEEEFDLKLLLWKLEEVTQCDASGIYVDFWFCISGHIVATDCGSLIAAICHKFTQCKPESYCINVSAHQHCHKVKLYSPIHPNFMYMCISVLYLASNWDKLV